MPFGHEPLLDARPGLTMLGTCNARANYSLDHGEWIASTEQVGSQHGS